MLRAYIREGDRLVPTDFDPQRDRPCPSAVWYSLTDPSREEGQVRRSLPRHRHPDPPRDAGHRALRPPLQRGRRRVHDHHRAGSIPTATSRSRRRSPSCCATTSSSPSATPTPNRSACSSASSPRPPATRPGRARDDRPPRDPSSIASPSCSKPPATTSTRSRARCSATRPPSPPARPATCRA